MKIRKPLNRNILRIMLFIFFILVAVTGCGGGGGGSSSSDDTTGVWDQMTWDDSNWQ